MHTYTRIQKKSAYARGLMELSSSKKTHSRSELSRLSHVTIATPESTKPLNEPAGPETAVRLMDYGVLGVETHWAPSFEDQEATVFQLNVGV